MNMGPSYFHYMVDDTPKDKKEEFLRNIQNSMVDISEAEKEEFLRNNLEASIAMNMASVYQILMKGMATCIGPTVFEMGRINNNSHIFPTI